MFADLTAAVSLLSFMGCGAEGITQLPFSSPIKDVRCVKVALVVLAVIMKIRIPPY